MLLGPREAATEYHGGRGAGGTLLLGSVVDRARDLRRDYAGQVQCLYMDPPFFTGQRFEMRARVGEAEWRAGRGSLKLPAYSDQWESEAEYLALLREALGLARDLLREDGLLFLHIDYRMFGKLQRICDGIFGEEHLLNEIVWAYQSGGRSKYHFSRKHDNILLYSKGKKPHFDIAAVAVPRGEYRSNHMRRQVDAQGRSFRTIRSGGKEYVYYDDEPVFLSDVWTDISHLQQKDPERTGYDTQKPLRLLERVILCASRPGDLVGDLFFGSGTTLAAAAGLGRRFLGVDVGGLAHSVARRRLLGHETSQELASPEPGVRIAMEVRPLIGYYQARLLDYLDPQGRQGLDSVDQWSAGLLQGDSFVSYAHAARSAAAPVLADTLEMPMLSGTPAVLVTDVYGRRQVYECPFSP